MSHFILQVGHHFSAARALRDYEGKCQNTHGHNFSVKAAIRTEDDAKGYALDFYDVQRQLADITEKFDHQFLNEIEPFTTLNPTTENLAKVIAEQLCIDASAGQLVSVTVAESEMFSACYYL